MGQEKIQGKVESQKGPKEGTASGKRESRHVEASMYGWVPFFCPSLILFHVFHKAVDDLGPGIRFAFVQVPSTHPRAWCRNGIQIEIWKDSFLVFLSQV